jgi:hypothetical protein
MNATNLLPAYLGFVELPFEFLGGSGSFSGLMLPGGVEGCESLDDSSFVSV